MIRPLPGFVLIEPIEEDLKTSSGVYVPEVSKDKPMKGKVIACGDDKKNYWDAKKGMPTMEIINCPVKVGQIVVHKKWINEEVQHESKTYLLIPFDQLMAVIE